MVIYSSSRFARLFFFILLLSACRNNSDSDTLQPANKYHENSAAALSDKSAYQVNEQVKLTLVFDNAVKLPAVIDGLKIQIRKISDSLSPIVLDISKDTSLQLKPGQHFVYENFASWNIPADAKEGAYGIYLQYETDQSSEGFQYKNFFRIIKRGDFTTYQIDHTSYNDIDIYALHGGMSAECVVEKAAENLGPGISHSWFLNAPGAGPEHVLATPEFLSSSVKRTIEFYNKSLGENTSFETVIIGPGLETIPYLSFTLKAPVLPLHFLASCNTVKEIQTILDYSNKNGYVSYATLGHDFSVPYAVAWVKLLDMPDEYLQFLKQHHVKNIVFAGYAGSDGENTAKKVENNATGSQYSPGSLYILYPGGGSAEDLNQLQQKIADFKSVRQQNNYVQIADWESGITDEQLMAFKKKASTMAGISDTRYITTQKMIHLWDLATYASVAFYHKNAGLFTKDGGPAVKDIILNPYFVTNAVYEFYYRLIPFIYWQQNSNNVTAARLTEVVSAGLIAYFPEMKTKNLGCWINSSNNFGGKANAGKLKDILQQQGFTTYSENDFTKDDVWNPSDGMTSPVEMKTKRFVQDKMTSVLLRNWLDKLKPLSLEDIDELGKKFPQILIR